MLLSVAGLARFGRPPEPCRQGRKAPTEWGNSGLRSLVPLFVHVLALLALLVFFGPRALAQDFGGVYQGSSQAGPVTVTLEMTGDEFVGTLSASGVEFALEGWVQQGVGVGLAYTGEGSVGFEAYLEGMTLGLYLFEMDSQGAPVVESVIELLLTKQTGGGVAATPAAAGRVIATGTYGSLSEDAAVAFIEALEFVLGQVGYAYTFSDTDRAEAFRALAANYPAMSQMDQVVLSQAREIWQGVQVNWATASSAEQREFALGVLILAFGEQTVSSWVGPGSGGGGLGGGASCTTFEDCTSSFVDEGTWTDTFNAQGCWAAAGCGGYDASSNSFDYGSY